MGATQCYLFINKTSVFPIFGYWDGQVLYPGNYVPSLTHRFIKALETRGKLLRNFTQNIDGLGENKRPKNRVLLSTSPFLSIGSVVPQPSVNSATVLSW